MPDIPMIDLSSWADPTATDQDRSAAAQTLDEACSEVGFFYMRLPGLAEAAERLLVHTRALHSLSPEEKEKIASHLSPAYRGYNCTWATGAGSCAARPGEPPDPKEVRCDAEASGA